MIRVSMDNSINRTWNKNFLDFLSVLWCALFLGLIVLRDIYDISVHYLILTGVFGCAMLFSSYENAVAFFCMILPMTNGLKGAAIYPVAFLVLFLRRKKSFSPMQLVFPLFFILYEWILCHWDPDVQYFNLIYFSAAMLLFGYFLFDRKEGVHYKKALAAYILGTAFFVAIILVISLRDHEIFDYFRTNARFGALSEYPEDRDIMRDNQNYVAYYCLTAVAAYIPLLHSSMKLIYKLLLAFPVLFCLFCGILTVSRAFALAFVVLAAFYVLIHLRFDRRSFFVLCGVGLAAVVAYSLLEKYPFVLDRFFDRFGESNVTIDDDRVHIISMYNDYMLEHHTRFFFGTGTLSCMAVTGFNADMHNGTQQIFVCYGLIGFILFVLPIIYTFIRANRPKMVRLVYFIPLLAVVGFTQTIQFLNPSVLMMPMILALFSIKIGQEEMQGRKEIMPNE